MPLARRFHRLQAGVLGGKAMKQKATATRPTRAAGQLSLSQMFKAPAGISCGGGSTPSAEASALPSAPAVCDAPAALAATKSTEPCPPALPSESASPPASTLATSTQPSVAHSSPTLSPSKLNAKLPRCDPETSGGPTATARARNGQAAAASRYGRAPGKPPCPHGVGCYRKNPAHFLERDHPEQHPLLCGEKQMHKRARLETASLATPLPGDADATDDDESSPLAPSHPEDGVKRGGVDVGGGAPPADASAPPEATAAAPPEATAAAPPQPTATAPPQPTATAPPQPTAATLPAPYPRGNRSEWGETLRRAFLVPVGDDLFALADVCCKEHPKAPVRALRTAGVQLLAPFQLLLGEIMHATPLSDRDVHDPPEFQPLLRVLADPDQPPSLIGYWRDEPDDPSPLIVRRKPMGAKDGPGVTFAVIGDNLLSATHFLLHGVSSGGTMRAAECRKLCGALADAAAVWRLPMDGGGEKCKAAAARKRKVVGPTSNLMGIVVPYDKKSQVGYRQLHLGGSELRQLLSSLVHTKKESRGKFQAELDDLINWANIANDESDFGASLRLGMDIFNHSPALALLAGRTLQTAYTLLGRDTFCQIAAAHARVRASSSTSAG